MDEHPNAKLVREMIDDPVNTEVAFVTDDVDWHFIGPIPTLHTKAELEGPIRGRQQRTAVRAGRPENPRRDRQRHARGCPARNDVPQGR
jgi:hypothetical protein